MLGDKQVIIHSKKTPVKSTSGYPSKDSENKFRVLFNNTYDAIFLMKDDTFVDCNPRTEVMFGYSREELLGNKPYNFSPLMQPDGENSKEKARDKINKALRGIPQSFEWTHCRKNGVTFDAEVSLNRVEIEGELLIQAIVRDITQRKETETELLYRIDFEKFIASISSNFINLAADEIDKGIRNALEDVGIFAGVDRSYIFLLDEKNDVYTISYEWCNYGIASLSRRNFAVDTASIPWWHNKLTRFETIRIADASILPSPADRERDLLRSMGIRSILCAPLRIGKSLIGFLGFDSVTEKKNWSMESINLLRIIGETISSALERKNRDDKLRRLADQRKRLLEVSTSLLTTLNLDEVLRQTLKVLREIISFDECNIHLLDRSRKVLHPYIVVDAQGNQIESTKCLVPLGKGIVSAVLESGKAEMVNEAHNDPRSYYPKGKQIDREHIICAPMLTKHKLLGTFLVARHNDKPFSVEEFELVQLFVGYATIGMENAELYEELNKKLSYNAALNEISEIIGSNASLDKILTRILEKSLAITKSQRGSLMLVDKGSNQLFIHSASGYSNETVKNIRLNPGEGIAGQVFETGETFYCEDVCNNPQFARFRQEEDIRSILSVPLIVKGEVIGVLNLDTLIGDQPLGSEDVHFVEEFALQAAVAIDNDRLFERIKSSEERYRKLFEDSKDGVFTSTYDGHIIDINPAGIEMLGYDSIKELEQVNIGQDLYVKPRLREEYAEILKEKGYVKDFEAQLRRKDGQTIECLVTSSAYIDDKSGKLHFRGFLRDVTEQKKLEEQLRQTQKMESLGQLAGGIAHDFNNVLGIVQVGLSALRSKIQDKDSPLLRYVDMCENAGERGADVARRLLTFSQSEKVNRAPMRINDVVKDLTNVLRHTIEKNISIETKVPHDIPPVLGDHGQVYQMLLNLCVNARDAIVESQNSNNSGVIDITVDLVDEDVLPDKRLAGRDKQYIKITVTDNGIGLPDPIKNKIFDPFYTTKTKGTGLGLSVVYGIVQSHQGAIDVISEEGNGTRFSVYLPTVDADFTESTDTETIENVKGNNETILIVEDEEILCTLLEEVLTENGYRVLKAVDGKEALEIYRKCRYDIDTVIMDMGLPKLSGQALFLKIMQINPSEKIILASGYLEKDLKEDLFELGATAYIQKPYKAVEILRSVQKALHEVQRD